VEKMDKFEADETYQDDKEYVEWQKAFVWTDHKDDIQQILGKNPTIMNLYQELGILVLLLFFFNILVWFGSFF
jgi:hypothetical protein